MAIGFIGLPYGLRNVKITGFTTAAATAYNASSVNLPYSRTFSFSEVEEFNTLRGDDRDIASHGGGPSVKWALESGGVPLDALKLMYGGTISETGVTPNQVKKLTKLVTDQRPYFKAEGQAISDTGGDVHPVVYKCKATDDLAGDFKVDEFFLTGAGGIGIASTVPADIDKVWDLVQNETATAIP